MNSSNNLSNNRIIFDVILSNTELYDYQLDKSEVESHIRNSYKFEYYDIEVVSLTSKFDIKLDTSEYNDIEVVMNKVNYFPDEITIIVGNQLLTEDGEYLLTEDGFELLY
jgi:hypothetical protein